MTAVSVDELRRAWAAVEAGEFRAIPLRADRPRTSARWEPPESVIVVAGVTGRVGASTVAMALATVAARGVRVVECSSTHRSGMMTASTAELGVDAAGWRCGSRDGVRIERTTAAFRSPSEVPAPSPIPSDLTVVDVGWDLVQVLDEDSWLATAVMTSPLVLVTVATVPGLRALDEAIRATGRLDDTWCVVVGPPRRKWPRSLHLASSATEALDERGRLFAIPSDSTLALNGLSQDPLPTRLVSACHPIFDRLSAQLTGTTNP